MTPIVRATRPRVPIPRRLQLLLRDGTAIEGTVKVGADQSLVSFLNSRSGWMSVTQATRSKDTEPAGHMLVQLEHIVMASAPDGKLQVASTPIAGVDERIVELTLLGGRAVRGYLPVAPGQRLSDCVAAAGRFMGLTLARLYPEEQDVGDVAVQSASLAIVRDLRAAAPEPE
jgi:hypothetical protein